MWRLLKFLVTGDWHLCTWEEVKESDAVRGETNTLIGHIYYCKCTYWGTMTQFKLGNQKRF